MMAHDDDQDLVIIRIPRRAAALYASELDVVSSPWMASLALYGRVAGGLAAILAATGFAFVGVYQMTEGDPAFASICFGFTVIWGGVGSFLFSYGLSQITAARKRGLG